MSIVMAIIAVTFVLGGAVIIGDWLRARSRAAENAALDDGREAAARKSLVSSLRSRFADATPPIVAVDTFRSYGHINVKVLFGSEDDLRDAEAGGLCRQLRETTQELIANDPVLSAVQGWHGPFDADHGLKIMADRALYKKY